MFDLLIIRTDKKLCLFLIIIMPCSDLNGLGGCVLVLVLTTLALLPPKAKFSDKKAILRLLRGLWKPSIPPEKTTDYSCPCRSFFGKKKKEKNRKTHSKKIDLAVLSLQKINVNFRNLDDAASYAHIHILLFFLTGFSLINDQVFSRELIIENANQSFWPI